MSALLPTVSKETAASAICDVLRAEITEGQDESILMGWVDQAATENPEILKTIACFFDDRDMDEKTTAIAAMAITYRVLSAQAEVSALERMTAEPPAITVYPANDRCEFCAKAKAEHPYCCIERGKVHNYMLCAPCLLASVDPPVDTDVEDGYDHEAAMERIHGHYVEGEYPGASL